jgi:hypothetical protein
MEDVNRTWRCSVEEPSGVWDTECWESGLRDWGDLAESLSDTHVTDPISHNLVKWEGKPDRGVGDAHSSVDNQDNIFLAGSAAILFSTLHDGKSVAKSKMPARFDCRCGGL